jgi:hypothetical protein
VLGCSPILAKPAAAGPAGHHGPGRLKGQGSQGELAGLAGASLGLKEIFWADMNLEKKTFFLVMAEFMQ